MKNKFLNTGIEGYKPLKKISIALKGIYIAALYDFAVAYKVVFSTLLMAVFFHFRQWLDFSLVLLATGLVLTAEIFNTAIEAICDFIETENNEKIGLIKDVSAGAVGLSIFIWFVVIIIEIVRGFFLLYPNS